MTHDSATIPPELTRPTPRNVRIAGGGITSAAVAAVVLLLAAAGAALVGNRAAETMQERAALHSNGLSTEGEVVETWRAGRGQGVLVAQYTFAAEGAFVSGKADVPQRLEKNFQKYSVISVRYLPSNPGINHPSAWEESALSTWLPEIAPLLLAVLGIRLLFLLRREKKLLAEGVPAIAEVGKCYRSRAGFATTYVFATADEQQEIGGYTFSSRQESGAKLCILYLQQKPRSSQPYSTLDSYRFSE